jgi:hypothetical protein
MALRHRSWLSALALLVIAAFVVLGRWYALRRATPTLAASSQTLTVTTDADGGPGSLREALFVADTAASAARIQVHVASIRLQSALPPLVNPHGIHIEAGGAGLRIDAHAVRGSAPVFDVDAEGSSIEGLTIAGCPGTAILVRAARFRLTSSTVQACDVGVDVVGTSGEIGLERNHFDHDRIGVRFSGASPDSEVVKNDFLGNGTAGLWLVASQPQAAGSAAISVHDNRFSQDGTDAVVGNIPVVLADNDFTAVRTAAIQVIGTDAMVRGNHVSGGAAAGLLLEDARGAVIESNDLDHLQGYGILLRNSTDTLIRSNRIHSCAYGIGFVLGDERHPNTAVGNTLLDLRYDGIDVIGESPILRSNQVLQARAFPLRVTNFAAPDGAVVRARPLLERNSFQLASVAGSPARASTRR